MSFGYRALGSDDAAQWRALRVEGARDFPMGFLVTVEETEADDTGRCADILSYGTVRGVFDGDRMLGFCGYRPERLERTRHRATLGPFFVTASAHGSGAARAMMEGVVAEATEAGLVQLELFVDTENTRAIAFYERHGFKHVATHPGGVRIDGLPRDDYFYQLHLG